MRLTSRLAAHALMLAALCGCALPTARQAPVLSYRLQGIQTQVPAPGVTPFVLRVLPLDAAPGLDATQMLYSAQPGQLMPYRDSRWLAPPPLLVRAALAQSLARQPWISAVEQDTPLGVATLTLHCGLDRLEHDLGTPHGSVRLDLQCQLLREADASVVAHWREASARTLEVDDAAHYALAAQDLLDAALADVVQRVAAAAAH